MKKTNEPSKFTVRIKDAVSVYKTLCGLKINKLKKEDIFAVLRAANALKPVASAFDDFLKDVRDRLKPENWDSVMEKRGNFESLPDVEKMEINKIIAAYDKDVNDCLQSELNRETEVADFAHLTEEAIADIVANNEALDVFAVMEMQEVVG